MRVKGYLFILLLVVISCTLDHEDNKSRFKSSEEAISYLDSIGFIQNTTSGRNYSLEKLDNQDYKIILDLINSIDSKKQKAPSFYLKITGLTLPQNLNRMHFVEGYLRENKTFQNDFILLENLVSNKPENQRLKKGLINFAKALDSDQILILLRAYGFVLMSNSDHYGYSIHQEEIDHLSPEILSILSDNLGKGQHIGQKAHIAGRIKELIEEK